MHRTNDGRTTEVQRRGRRWAALETPEARRAGMYGVYTGSRAYRYDDQEVLPAGQFLKRLHEGGVF